MSRQQLLKTIGLRRGAMDATVLTQLISTHLSIEGFELCLKPEWSSAQEGHRAALRRGLQKHLNLSPSVTDLAVLPDAVAHTISISHCKRAGGFAVAPGTKILGFDIEINRRLEGVQLRLVRVNETEELSAPTPHAFWTAKEAAFKCLRGSGQPRGLKDILVGDWAQAEPGVWRFRILEIDGQPLPNGIPGLVVDDGELSYAICVREKDADKKGVGHALVAH